MFQQAWFCECHLDKTAREQIEDSLLHQDNAPAHQDHTTVLELDSLGLDHVCHAHYSPDLHATNTNGFEDLSYCASRVMQQQIWNTKELTYVNKLDVNGMEMFLMSG